MDYMKVKNYPELVRDIKTNAIINVDNESLNKYKEERNFKLKVEKSLKINEDLQKEVSNIKNDISDIKNLLTQLIGQK